jgi:hypothetical protein
MTNQALIYHRPSKWPIATALGTAVLIHLSAVAIAFHRESPATEPAIVDDFVPFGFEPADDPPIPLIPTSLCYRPLRRQRSISSRPTTLNVR